MFSLYSGSCYNGTRVVRTRGRSGARAWEARRRRPIFFFFFLHRIGRSILSIFDYCVVYINSGLRQLLTHVTYILVATYRRCIDRSNPRKNDANPAYISSWEALNKADMCLEEEYYHLFDPQVHRNDAYIFLQNLALIRFHLHD